MDWKECNEKKLVKKIKQDTELIKSLIESSSKKFESANRLKLDEVTATSKFSLYYESLRELLEALAIKSGYKIYNHECYCSFLSEIIKDKDNSLLFNKIRKTRNAVNYYGNDLPLDNAKDIIKDTINLVNHFKKEINL